VARNVSGPDFWCSVERALRGDFLSVIFPRQEVSFVYDIFMRFMLSAVGCLRFWGFRGLRGT
jgi:hypothetical protein